MIIKLTVFSKEILSLFELLFKKFSHFCDLQNYNLRKKSEKDFLRTISAAKSFVLQFTHS